jgi:hypothetical protein
MFAIHTVEAMTVACNHKGLAHSNKTEPQGSG